MIKTLFVVALLTAAPTVANAKAEPAPPVVPSAVATDAPAKAVATQRYCVLTEITGSRIPYRTCMTRDQWLAEGFDPTAK